MIGAHVSVFSSVGVQFGSQSSSARSSSQLEVNTVTSEARKQDGELRLGA
jgi:hypothetical protein